MGKNPGYGHGTTTLVNLATHFKSTLVWVYPAKHPLEKERLDYTNETTFAIVSYKVMKCTTVRHSKVALTRSIKFSLI